ncbi:DUF4870 domain-containing protein [Polaribacter tangerinus]|uniref:DUF4870 domain-containing protein n=1 Tax=Polaribacter tangerinus TaxID=1920034 RepID=UPI000B4AB16B|nr:DUF4870 domain-containing protein [Polaribacter tangerinus]
MKNNNENTNAFLIHISSFAGFIFPFGHIITPLIAWQTLKDRSNFLDEQGKEVVNFNLSYTLYVLIIGVLFLPFAIGSFFRNINDFGTFNLDVDFSSSYIIKITSFALITGIIYLIGIALVIIGAIKAKDGEQYSYPFTIKFIK